MKKKLRLPILLLAVVVMLSIFYIKEAQDNPQTPVNGDSYNTSTLNPEFTEARLLSIEEVNSKVSELEASISSGDLSATEVMKATAEINSLKDIKHKEVVLENTIIETNNYDDVLVLLGDEYLVVDIYTEDEIPTSTFVEIAIMAKESFGNDVNIKLKTTNNVE